MVRIYTRSGDDGFTSLVGGARTSKNSPRLEVYGTVDELNALVGLTAAGMTGEADRDLKADLLTIQHHLFDCGADLAAAHAAAEGYRLADTEVTALEEWIDRYVQQTEE
ncbi:MAG: ATP:cob(I)alamin adenosyltransferase, partial [Candidatus Hinthialibacter sp.]